MYGQTTSGKTYTMLGTAEQPGVLPCALRDVFRHIEQAPFQFRVWVSYLEIYNESIHDLLVSQGQGQGPGGEGAALKIREDPRMQGPDVAGLKRQQVWSFEQAVLLMNFGEEQRTYKATRIHEHSSRSHAIFRLYLEAAPLGEAPRFSCLNLVDLAGSERLTEPEGAAETQHINKSLFVLSHVIKKLAEGKE